MSITITTLTNGKTILSTIPYEIVFTTGIVLPPGSRELFDNLVPKYGEEEVMLPNNLKTVKLVKYLTEKQKEQLDELQTKADIVILPRYLLDVLNEHPEERIGRFGKCVGQYFTAETMSLPPSKKIVRVDIWAY